MTTSKRTKIVDWQLNYDTYMVKGKAFNSKIFTDGAIVNLSFEKFTVFYYNTIIYTEMETYYLFNEDELKDDLGG